MIYINGYNREKVYDIELFKFTPEWLNAKLQELEASCQK